MSEYKVIVEGTVREVHYVTAQSEAEALREWWSLGVLVRSEWVETTEVIAEMLGDDE